MLADDFDARVARLEEHLVSPSAEETLEKAERLFAEEGNTVWAQLALAGAKLQRTIDESRRSRELAEWEDDDDAS